MLGGGEQDSSKKNVGWDGRERRKLRRVGGSDARVVIYWGDTSANLDLNLLTPFRKKNGEKWAMKSKGAT